MAKQHFVKKARTNIFQFGEPKTKTHRRGKKKGQKYTCYDRSQPRILLNEQNGEWEAHDTLLVEEGEPYYWCKFKGQQRRISKTPFTFDELHYGRYGKNEWEVKYNDYQDRVNNCAGVEGLEDDANDLREEIEEYKDELQERLDNIPEQLQESSILNERIEVLDNLIAEIDDN